MGIRLFRRFIIDYIGVYTRYYFLKLIGREKSLDFLSGKNDSDSGMSQGFVNALVGFSITALLFITVAYLYYSLGIQ